jgi:hypothetical protein
MLPHTAGQHGKKVFNTGTSEGCRIDGVVLERMPDSGL